MRLYFTLLVVFLFLQSCNNASKTTQKKSKISDSLQISQKEENVLPVKKNKDTIVFWGNETQKIQIISNDNGKHYKYIILDARTKDTLLNTTPVVVNEMSYMPLYGGEKLTLTKDTLRLDFYSIPNIPMSFGNNEGTYIGNICIFFGLGGKLTSKVEMHDFSKEYKTDLTSIKERYNTYTPHPMIRMGQDKTWNHYFKLIDDILLCALMGNPVCQEMLDFKEQKADGAISQTQGFAKGLFLLYHFYKNLSLKTK